MFKGFKMKKYKMSANEIYDLLKEMIFDWRLKPGEKINISKLSKELDISPIPLREALSRLHSTKLILFEANKGYKVSEILNDAQMFQLIEARTLIEKHSVVKGIRYEKFTNIDKLISITNEMSELKLGKSFKTILNFVYLDQKFHNELLKVSDNEFLIEGYKNMYSHFHIARFYKVRGGVDQQEATSEHHEIIKAIKMRDIYQAEVAINNHIINAKDRLLENTNNHFMILNNYGE